MITLSNIDPQKPVLIYGPTASGKSGLAIDIALAQGGVIVNADALQVYGAWKILTAQPTQSDLSRVAHHLYGHLAYNAPYSVGDWLRDVAPFLQAHAQGGPRPIIVGGTGLYFTALTEGLADIPPTPPHIRQQGDSLPLANMIAALDSETAASMDLRNRARVQRAWEVQASTGRGIRSWQSDTPAPILAPHTCTALALLPDVAWLNARIEKRFDLMLADGVLQEAKAICGTWDPEAPSSKAIGARALIQVLNAETSIASAREQTIIATRQYAKRQRTWLRSRMTRWQVATLPDME